jgi:hypothetical protein
MFKKNLNLGTYKLILQTVFVIILYSVNETPFAKNY